MKYIWHVFNITNLHVVEYTGRNSKILIPYIPSLTFGQWTIMPIYIIVTVRLSMSFTTVFKPSGAVWNARLKVGGGLAYCRYLVDYMGKWTRGLLKSHGWAYCQINMYGSTIPRLSSFCTHFPFNIHPSFITFPLPFRF